MRLYTFVKLGSDVNECESIPISSPISILTSASQNNRFFVWKGRLRLTDLGDPYHAGKVVKENGKKMMKIYWC